MNEYRALKTRTWPHVTVLVWRSGAWIVPPDRRVHEGERLRLDAVSGDYGVARGYLTPMQPQPPAAPETPAGRSGGANPGDPPWLGDAVAACAALDAADPERARADWWLRNGRPKAAALAAEAGIPALSATQRDAAWARHAGG